MRDVKPGGAFLINCQWTAEELERAPVGRGQALHRRERHQALHSSTPSTWPSRSAWASAPTPSCSPPSSPWRRSCPQEEAIQYMKDAATKSYAKKGQDIVDMNHKAIDAGATAFVQVEVPDGVGRRPRTRRRLPASRAVPRRSRSWRTSCSPWAAWTATPCPCPRSSATKTASSRWAPRPTRSAAWPCRCPSGTPDTCIQCNQCAFVCPHATIRPFALTDEELASGPGSDQACSRQAARWALTCSTRLPSRRSTAWAAACASSSARPTSLTMMPMADTLDEQPVFDYCVSKVARKPELEATRRSRAASSSSPCSSSPAPAPAAPRPPMPAWSPSCSAIACTSPTRRAAPPSGAVRQRRRPTRVNADGHGPAWSNSPVRGQRRARHGHAARLRGRAGQGRR